MMTSRFLRFLCLAVVTFTLMAVVFVLALWKGLPPSPAAILTTVVLPVLVAGFGCAALWRGRDWQLAYVLSVAAMGGAAVAAEAYLDFVHLPRMRAELGRLADQRADLVASQQQSHRAKGEEWPYAAGCSFAYPRCNQSESAVAPDDPALLPVRSGRVIPLGGISRVTTVFCSEGEGLIVYQADEYGFNNPSGLWSQAPLDVLLVGDSYTHGACVERASTFAGVVGQTYAKTISLGISGNGPILELAGLREYGPTLRPKVVVWVFTIDNDFSDLERENLNPVLRRYLTDGFSQELMERQAEIDDGLKQYFIKAMAARQEATAAPPPRKDEQVGQGASAKEFLTLASLRRLLGIYFSRPARDYQGVASILAQAKSLTESWGGRMIVVFQPSSYAFIGFNRFDRINDMLQEDTARMVAGLGLPYVDGLAVLRQAEAQGPVFWGLGSHSTSLGYRVLGAAIRDKVGEVIEALPDHSVR